MLFVNKTITGLSLVLALLGAMPVAQAATYHYTIEGTVLGGDETYPNVYNLTAGETISATGSFTADLGTLGSETGTVSFATGSGNTMTIDLNGTLLFASNDDGYASGLGPYLTFDSGANPLVSVPANGGTTYLTDFDFQKTSSPAFDSSFSQFDDFGGLYGEWTSVSLTAVPVPAAAWLFASGLLGLAGIAKRKQKS